MNLNSQPVRVSFSHAHSHAHFVLVAVAEMLHQQISWRCREAQAELRGELVQPEVSLLYAYEAGRPAGNLNTELVKSTQDL